MHTKKHTERHIDGLAPGVAHELDIPAIAGALDMIEAAGLGGKLDDLYGTVDPIAPDTPFEDIYLFALMAERFPVQLSQWDSDDLIMALRILNASQGLFWPCLDNLPAVMERMRLVPTAQLAQVLGTLDSDREEFVQIYAGRLAMQRPAFILWQRGHAPLEHAARFRFDIKYTHPERISPNEAFDRWPSWLAFRLYCGESPRAVFGGLLTSREAHSMLHDREWLKLCATSHELGYYQTDAAHWLAWKLGIPLRLASRLRHPSRTVVLWLAKKHMLPAMCRQRAAGRHIDGITATYCYLDRIDEIRDADLVNGEATSIEAAFRSAHERRLAIEGDRGDLVLPSSPLDTPAGICHLGTSGELRLEGLEMRHCVATYVDLAISKTSYIYSVSTGAGRSTVELRRGGQGYYLAQHRGFLNNEPPQENKDAVDNWLKAATRIGRRVEAVSAAGR